MGVEVSSYLRLHYGERVAADGDLVTEDIGERGAWGLCLFCHFFLVLYFKPSVAFVSLRWISCKVLVWKSADGLGNHLYRLVSLRFVSVGVVFAFCMPCFLSEYKGTKNK